VISNLTSGWQVNGITIIQGGVPLGLTTSANQTNSFGGSRPNNSGHSAKLSGPIEARLNKYFNTSVFSQPAAFTFGNTARTLPDVRAPGVINFDFSVIKDTKLHERASMQFRAESFNSIIRTSERRGQPSARAPSASSARRPTAASCSLL
jgi:hypothetical protein